MPKKEGKKNCHVTFTWTIEIKDEVTFLTSCMKIEEYNEKEEMILIKFH